MAQALKKNSKVGFKKETVFGQDPTLGVANIIEVGDFDGNSEFEIIERAVISGSFDELAPIRGPETVSIGTPLELHGSGTPGTEPEGSDLWEAGIGPKNVSTATTTHGATACTTTILELLAGGGAGIAVKDAILVDPLGGTAYEVVWITAKTGDQITVSPALSSAPGVLVAIGAGVHYKLSTAELASIFASYWRGDITREDYFGCKVEEISLDFQNGRTVNPNFRLQGASGADPVAQTYAASGLGTPSYDSVNASVHIARYMTVKIAGVTYKVSNIAMSIANEVFRKGDVTISGASDIPRVARKVSGSFSLFYENKNLEADFRADTESEMVIVSSAGQPTLTPGNIFATRMPRIRYTAVPKSEESGLYKYDVSFRAVMNVGEDSLTSVSWL